MTDTPKHIAKCSLTLLSLLLLAACGPHHTTAGQTVVQPNHGPAPNIPAGAINNIHMINTTVGWAQTLNISGAYLYGILRTTDGGEHWQEIAHSKL